MIKKLCTLKTLFIVVHVFGSLQGSQGPEKNMQGSFLRGIKKEIRALELNIDPEDKIVLEVLLGHGFIATNTCIGKVADDQPVIRNKAYDAHPQAQRILSKVSKLAQRMVEQTLPSEALNLDNELEYPFQLSSTGICRFTSSFTIVESTAIDDFKKASGEKDLSELFVW